MRKIRAKFDLLQDYSLSMHLINDWNCAEVINANTYVYPFSAKFDVEDETLGPNLLNTSFEEISDSDFGRGASLEATL